jgi:HEAT repeat protein
MRDTGKIQSEMTKRNSSACCYACFVYRFTFNAADKSRAATTVQLLLLCVCGLLAVCGCNESYKSKPASTEVRPVSSVVPEAVRIIEDALADADPSIRDNAIEVVAETRQIELMPKVKQLLTDEFMPVRFTAALAVGDMQYRFAEESVSKLLKDRDENVRIAAAYAMVKFGYTDNIGLIRKAIASKDQEIRANAALILGKTGDPDQLELLNWALSDKDSLDKVRFQVAEAMAMLKDDRVYPKLWTMLISAYADDRVMGVKAMGLLGTEPAKNALITMLDDKVLEVRLAAAEQLGALGNTQGQSEVLDVFRKDLTAGMDAESIERVHTFTALAIGRIRTAAVTEFLPGLLKSQFKHVRIASAKAVLQCAK